MKKFLLQCCTRRKDLTRNLFQKLWKILSCFKLEKKPTFFRLTLWQWLSAISEEKAGLLRAIVMLGCNCYIIDVTRPNSVWLVDSCTVRPIGPEGRLHCSSHNRPFFSLMQYPLQTKMKGRKNLLSIYFWQNHQLFVIEIKHEHPTETPNENFTILNVIVWETIERYLPLKKHKVKSSRNVVLTISLKTNSARKIYSFCLSEENIKSKWWRV